MIIALKRILHDAAFLVLLGCIILVPFLGFAAGKNIHTPPYGFVCESESDDGARLCAELTNAGFIRCADEAELKDEIREAHLDCGVLIADDISNRLAENRTDESMVLVTSPETLMAELCRIEAVSALSVVYSPHVTYESLGGSIGLERVKQVYYEMIGKGSLFAFDIETVDGEEFADLTRSINLFTGCLSILLMITVFIAVCRPVKRHYEEMRARLGKLPSFGAVLLPEFLLRTAFLMAAALLAAVVTGQTAMFSSIAIYTGIVSVIGLLLTMLLPETYIIIITVFASLLSLGLCPIFTDLSLVLPVVSTARYLLLPYYLWIL